MKTMQFRCKLLSDVILNVKAATEGNQNTLDFIPGNNFLGIVATDYESFNDQQRLDLFHNGIVRYGDAHPVSKGSATRSLRVPASMFYPKLQSIEDKCYIHHAYSRDQDHDGEGGKPQQLKQSREGFYEFSASEGVAVHTPKAFAIKSAYDRSQRRALDSQMFGYESLRKGTEFLFEVETDRDEYAPLIIDHLVGKHQIGRSRTAQYGLVEITVDEFGQPGSTDHFFMHDDKKTVVVYADSRLVFLDENGELTFRPKPEDLGLDGKISFQKEDCAKMSFSDNRFSSIISAFGVRNFENLDICLKEMHRVLSPGGHLIILELSVPRRFPMKQLFHFYSHVIMPMAGRIISKDASAYTYLPQSMEAFPQAETMKQVLLKAGFRKAYFERLTFGICTMFVAEK